MRRIVEQKQFRQDLKRQKRRGKDVEELIAAVELLAETGALPRAIVRTNCQANGKASGSATSSRTGC
jgi:mRNA-degrading endonuclease YafQ of YafQ-DinJ toxin-antitoxin module